MTLDNGLSVLVDYVIHAIPTSRLVSQEGPGRSQRVSLTFQDDTGKQYLLDVHENFYMGRTPEAIRERLDRWNIEQELQRGGARTLRLDEESFYVGHRYV